MADDILAGLERGLDVALAQQLSVIADRLEETGREDLARAYRWLVADGRQPLRFADRWHWRKGAMPLLELMHQLPDPCNEYLMRLPGRIGMNWNEAGLISSAYRLAADAIVAALGDSVGPLAPVRAPDTDVCFECGLHFTPEDEGDDVCAKCARAMYREYVYGGEDGSVDEDSIPF